MNIDCVFSGGGIKAYALVGALESIENKNLNIIRAAGTSAGAIIASFVAAGYKSDELKNILIELNIKEFMDAPFLMNKFPFSKWFYLYFKLGIYKGDKLERWLEEKLQEKNVFTFKDLEEDSLKIIVSDLSLGKLVVIPDDLERVYNIHPNDFSVAKAVRMSASFPYFFMPIYLSSPKYGDCIVVDGGLLSNFPLWVFGSCHDVQVRPVLGVKLGNKNQKKREIKQAKAMTEAMFKTMKEAHDERYLSTEEKKNIIFIPVHDIASMDFNIDENTKTHLYEQGRKTAEEFLEFWAT